MPYTLKANKSIRCLNTFYIPCFLFQLHKAVTILIIFKSVMCINLKVNYSFRYLQLFMFHVNYVRKQPYYILFSNVKLYRYAITNLFPKTSIMYVHCAYNRASEKFFFLFEIRQKLQQWLRCNIESSVYWPLNRTQNSWTEKIFDDFA